MFFIKPGEKCTRNLRFQVWHLSNIASIKGSAKVSSLYEEHSGDRKAKSISVPFRKEAELSEGRTGKQHYWNFALLLSPTQLTSAGDWISPPSASEDLHMAFTAKLRLLTRRRTLIGPVKVWAACEDWICRTPDWRPNQQGRLPTKIKPACRFHRLNLCSGYTVTQRLSQTVYLICCLVCLRWTEWTGGAGWGVGGVRGWCYLALSTVPLQLNPFVVMPAVSCSGPPSLSAEQQGRHQLENQSVAKEKGATFDENRLREFRTSRKKHKSADSAGRPSFTQVKFPVVILKKKKNTN